MSTASKKVFLIAALILIPVLSACDNDPIVGLDFGEAMGQWLDGGWW